MVNGQLPRRRGGFEAAHQQAVIESGRERDGTMVGVGRGSCGSLRVDRFEEWLHAPVPLESTDPRFDIRRAVPAEFDAIYDLVDESFGFQRPRAVYDWLYRHNPYGTARTQRCMAWRGFWSPHDADFLNWRYLGHPAGQYSAFALAAGTERVGYYVLKIEAQAAWLMEFVAPRSPRRFASTLLLHSIKTARDAGCAYIKFSAPRTWRHWRLFRAAGFLPVPSYIYLWPGGGPEVRELNLWQWVPGDMDDL